ncbi:membrane-spanning protein, putative [Entamoeba histolytica HM-1:IMSS-B]|uniref:Membrane-spanning protein, putative n=4 Tax=Entamoeba histolytica TaxID=5759 RepID=M3TXR0_ENTH1|nr:uncharacterized protein EHI_025380 [Entamoeba histolytica HM-1:IMSS]EAL47563.1 hypothetical membrane-spanning protein [Entamoeba histolytica HM-1:IMSS]EMD46711.1 Hypothetical protein EHI5A_019560 [Entamoeba histolytica KU27]EMH74275.1 membrane-spanning protein, putative [Entamoeba histolytica HM-1:IMSS-B]ENY65498.1 hypothetical protein EHI7A_009000 [Entamoeba histolytica HM-1:IMSS-A]|eukprot:XP_652949.1 uncharacterized protein EHI_025380 [Entamoeba histolytica HM-1:IMSS]
MNVSNKDIYLKSKLVKDQDNSFAGFVLLPSEYSFNDICILTKNGQLSDISSKGYVFFQLKTQSTYINVKKGTYRLVYFSCGNKKIKWVNAKIIQGYTKDGIYHYLSSGEYPMIMITEIFGFILLVVILYDLYLLYKRETHTVQTLITGFSIIIFLHLCFDVLTLKATDSKGISNIRYFDYTFRIIETLSFYIVTLLVASGWSRKSKFSFEQKKTLLFFILLQVLSNVLYLVAEENELVNTRVTSVLRLIDIICSICILFPLIKTLNLLKKNTGTEAKTLKQYQRFSRCYSILLTIAYVKILLAYINDIASTREFDFIYLSVDKSLYIIYSIYLMIAFRPKKIISSSDEPKELMTENTFDETKQEISKNTKNYQPEVSLNSFPTETSQNEEIKSVVLLDNNEHQEDTLSTTHNKNDICVELE